MINSKICLVLAESTLEQNLIQLAKYRSYIDLVELRADFLEVTEYAHLASFPVRVPLPVILTFRRTQDGGHFTDSEERRIELICGALNGEYAFVDLEEDLQAPTAEKAATRAGTRVIRSLHDFQGIPEDPANRLLALARTKNELPKLAVMPRSTADLVKLLRCSQATRKVKEKILIGMGDYGFATRILATKLGSYLTFCSVPEKNAAPGHIGPEELNGLYRFRKIDKKTRVFGIIGNPVMHTASPRIHNSGYSALKLNAVYVPFPVDELEAFLQVIKLLNLQGFSVTVPHKNTILPYLSRQTESLQKIGACNTVVRVNSGLKGSNTDAGGFITPLLEMFNGNLQGKKATVIGAGGAARAIVYALRAAGAQILILNRTLGKAEELAQTFGGRAASLTDESRGLIAEYSDVIAQTTTRGMVPDIDADPIAFYQFSGHEVVYEIVYKPAVTAMLQRAREAGCRTIPGMEMLLHQAYSQFLTFTGKPYPRTAIKPV